MHKQIIEGLLFLKGEEGITLELVEKVLDLSTFEADDAIKKFIKYWDENQNESALKIDYIGETWKFVTKAEHFPYYKKMFNSDPKKLSNSALEVLAVIAYNQPCRKSRIEYVRGVNSDSVLKRLEALNFIKVVGVEESVGNASLYGTTKEFLNYFGISSIEDLPPIKEFTITDLDENEVDLFLSKYTEKEEENETK